MKAVVKIPSLPELEVMATLFSVPISILISFEEGSTELPGMDAFQAEKFMQLRQRIIATRLRKALDDADLPRKDIATALGISPKELASYLAGKRTDPVSFTGSSLPNRSNCHAIPLWDSGHGWRTADSG